MKNEQWTRLRLKATAWQARPDLKATAFRLRPVPTP